LAYRAAGKVLGVRARNGRGEIPGEDRGGALRDGAEEGDDGVGPPVSGRGACDAGRALASGVTRGRADVRAQAVRVRGWGAGPRVGRRWAGRGGVLGGPRAGLGRTGEGKGGEGWAGFGIGLD
jgi:hypothetical protein